MVVHMVRATSVRHGVYWDAHDPALEILRERYAKGDIAKDQFDQMRRDIESRQLAAAPFGF